jgi:hypothetical protein
LAHRSTTLRRALFGASLTAGLVGISLPAMAYDDGYQNVFSSVLTAVGVLSPDKAPEIDYRERPPLVLPPKTALVPPEATKARPASWPQDPDVARRRREAEEAKAPPIFEFTRSQNGPLSKEEMMKGRAAPVNEADMTPKGCNGSKRNDGHCLLLTPDELKAQGERYRAQNPDAPKQVLTAGTEPERVYLTQPPRGYLKATKTVKATTEAPQPKIDESNPAALLVYRPKEDEQ